MKYFGETVVVLSLNNLKSKYYFSRICETFPFILENIETLHFYYF